MPVAENPARIEAPKRFLLLSPARRSQVARLRAAAFRRRFSERWGFVSFGDALGGVGVVEFAFGGDGSGLVVGAGVSTLGHHRAALTGPLHHRWLADPQGGGGLTKSGEQVLAARTRGVRVPGR
jgi:hypothetical protein